ncbi:MAG TPA: thiamine pyrophosphate-dependent enzyme [Gemmatimonadales bacterium]|nr:thiamine pyrophosphate-dependent enzyme [Gemmatimonadales bacterium]
MSSLSPADLHDLARRVRGHVIRMATGGGCFLGASLSCADLLVYLYARVLRVSPLRLQDPARDYLLLSKGHDVPALYGTLAELGFFPVGRLRHHLRPEDALYWHPNRKLPGVEFHSGSLGHLLSVGIGIAYDIRLSGGHNRVFVLLGDGELNEGSIWEGLLVARALGLANLVIVIDRNEFQANARTEALVPLEPLDAKLDAFGCRTVTVDGHDFAALDGAFGLLAEPRPGPLAIIARTVRGKGLPSIEARADRWFCNFSPTEIAALLRELEGDSQARLTSEELVVR